MGALQVLKAVAERGELLPSDHARMLLLTELAASEATRAKHVTHTGPGAVLISAVWIPRCYHFKRSFGTFTDRHGTYIQRMERGGYDGAVFANVRLGGSGTCD